jgi:hypothetical protein
MAFELCDSGRRAVTTWRTAALALVGFIVASLFATGVVSGVPTGVAFYAACAAFVVLMVAVGNGLFQSWQRD